MVRDVSLELQKAQVELHLWQNYRLLYDGCSEPLTHYWEQCEAFLSLPKKQEYDVELLQCRINNIVVSDSEASTPHHSRAKPIVHIRKVVFILLKDTSRHDDG